MGHRDPRYDPRQGDVLQHATPEGPRTYVVGMRIDDTLYVWDLHPKVVTLTYGNKYGISQWRDAMDTARVLHAEPQKP